MQDALKRLRALQQELEDLHRTTARVLAESEQLISALEGPAHRPAGEMPARRPKPKLRRSGAARTRPPR